MAIFIRHTTHLKILETIKFYGQHYYAYMPVSPTIPSGTNKSRWGVLRYDVFGYGLSKPTAEYLQTDPRPRVKHNEHAASIARNLIAMNTIPEGTSNAFSSKFVVIGLSRGGGIAIELTVAHPELVCGLVVVAGNLTGIDAPNTAEEKALIGQWYTSMQVGEIEKAATIFTRFWGDGPSVKEVRIRQDVREKLYAWCADITRREAEKSSGGFCIPYEGTDPPAVERLSTVKVPVATATGVYDETSTMEGMQLIIEKLKAVSVKEFDTAHMVNLEEPRALNSWIEEYLEKYVTTCIERQGPLRRSLADVAGIHALVKSDNEEYQELLKL